MSNFYEIATNYTEKLSFIQEGINPDTGEITDNKAEIEEWKNQVATDVKAKSRNIIHVLLQDDTFLKNIDEEIKRLQAIKKAKKQATDRFKDYLIACMESNGINSIETPIGKLSISKSKAVEVYDESLVDTKFVKEEIVRKVSKKDIRQAIKDGEEVQGARIVENLNIRVK